jgi:hypothetical protein
MMICGAETMKRSMLTAAVLGLLLATASPAHAAQQGWVQSAKVTRIVVTIDGGINFRLNPELSGCVSQSGYGPLYASVYPAHPGINRIHSVLMAAYLSDKPISVYFVDGQCKVGEVLLGGGAA